MIKIIKECRRPVVMTCNGRVPLVSSGYHAHEAADVHLVPTRDLPLQATLYFTPCLPPLAASYLRLRSFNENIETSTCMASQLYEGLGRHIRRQEPHPDNALHPHHISETPPDLRRTINQLQIGTHSLHEDQRRSVDHPVEDQSMQGLKRIAWSLELCSFADSWLRRPDAEVLHVRSP